jgi:cytochrome b561/polyisoprenoid-binding protein YceI
MPLSNTSTSYGAVARALHWSVALGILALFPLGLIAENLPYDSSEALARKAALFSVHKTLGVAVFALALLRILWALVSPHPVPLNPGRRGEVALAGAVHWILYASLVIVPLSGWVHHAAVTGFAPILWPLPQTLPFVPTSETVAGAAGAVHWVFTKVLAAAILLHVAGALKHHLIDRDATLLRMLRGVAAPAGTGVAARAPQGALPAFAAALVLALAGGAAALMRGETPPAPVPAPASAPTATAAAPAAAPGQWRVEEGTLSFAIAQMGAKVEGRFATFAAEITFDPAAAGEEVGRVAVSVDIASLSLGSVTAQALAPDFFDAATHPQARFTATLHRAGAGYEARGTLSLRGVERPLTLPFTLALDGARATMAGEVTLDRRDFGLGAAYPDEATVGFAATVRVALTAVQVP